MTSLTAAPPASRTAQITRTTSETDVRLALTLDGCGEANIDTGIGYLDHMLTLLAVHGGFDLALTCAGDLDVDDHHTAEDCAIALGRALDAALGNRRDICRYGDALIPMDDSLARCAIDLVTRPYAIINLGLIRPTLGMLATENITHFFRTLATEGCFTLHLDVLRGENDHHRSEAAFKALAAALRRAAARQPLREIRPVSTKGVL